MPSLRQRVTTYFRQLSFIAEPREGSSASLSPRNTDDGCFITKYLEGRLDYNLSGPEIKHGKEPSDLPDYQLNRYSTGSQTITAACTGPDEGLTAVKRSRLHLSAGPDIDFIDINLDQELEVRKSPSVQTIKSKLSSRHHKQDQNANKATTGTTTGTSTTQKNKPNSRKNSSTQIHQQQQNYHQPQSESVTIEKVTTIIDKKIESKQHHATINVIVSMVSTTPKKTANLQQEQLPQQPQLHENIDHSDNLNKNSSQTLPTKISPSIVESQPNQTSPSNQNVTLPTRKLSSYESVNELNKQLAEIQDPIAGVTNWMMETDHAYGISVSLYEKNPITNEQAGSPIADCYGLVARGNSVAMALADGVNWGEGARLAARSAVQGCLEYLDTAIFGQGPGGTATTTREVFISLLRSFWEAHDCILEVGGALTTLTVAVVLPLSNSSNHNLNGRFVVCSCNVGDSLGYVYSKRHGVREFTQGSHDITSMRDMRDALGALGPVDGNKPELGNLTLAMTIVDAGDIVFLTSDGISDNFDPVVGKFAEALTSESQIVGKNIEPKLAPKRQNKSTSAIPSSRQTGNRLKTSTTSKDTNAIPTTSAAVTSRLKSTTTTVPSSSSQMSTTSAIPVRPPRSKKTVSMVSNVSPSNLENIAPSRPKYMRSHTVIEPRLSIKTQGPAIIKFPKSSAGLPLVTGAQRHTLTLLRLEDLLSYGINGTLRPCPSAKKLCHLLVDFAKMITSAKRKILEQREIYFKIVTDANSVRREVELNRLQQRAARKRVVEGSTFLSLPGKLDHASIVAFTIGAKASETPTVVSTTISIAKVELVETDF